jgi:starch phosphorylase
VHAVTWASPPFQSLYDQHIPEWRHDSAYLRYIIGVPTEEISSAHLLAKRALFEVLRAKTGAALEENVLTIGFARRAATYKRFDLLFTDTARLRAVAEKAGPLQIIYAGKAHPRDDPGKAQIRRVFERAAELNGASIKVVYAEDYDVAWGRLLTSGVDLWLNTPQQPHEASGTSGMKAALNGVPSLSVLDGWWVEGCLEGVTGWAIGGGGYVSDTASEAASLYEKLELIETLFYERPAAYHEVMRAAIAINGSFFHTQRMVSQYMANAYFPAEPIGQRSGGHDETSSAASHHSDG